MVVLTDHGVFLQKNGTFCTDGNPEEGRKKTMAYRIMEQHNVSGDMEHLRLKFDALVSPDNNYVNILQTAKASGLKEFPVPYVLSNCHHTLCAVGGTINEDDHVFGLGNAKKYGGIFLPPYCGVLHQYMRERYAGCGRMILGSDSHARYGALGTMGIGEGGGEMVKQLLERTYDIKRPAVIAVKLTGKPAPGVGPQDIALALIAKTFQNGFNKNKILEFVGPGIQDLSVEYRMGIDVMTTESGALSSIWCTDEKVKAYLNMHGREDAYRFLEPEEGAYYDGLIEIDLSKVECMIALPFHPSNAMPIREFKEHLEEVVGQVEKQGREIKGDHGEPFSLMDKIRDGEFYVDQALVSGCSGGMFENIAAMADILQDYGISGGGIRLGVNPASLPIMTDLMKKGIAARLAVNGVTMRLAICGPCFGVTDVPANDQFSIRHTTRNYSNREGSKPGNGQMAAVALMDARSIAATVRNGGRLTAATELEVEYQDWTYEYDPAIYENQVLDCFGKADPSVELVMGPNIADWPKMYPMTEHLLISMAGVYEGSVTTDELIPSGEASSFRSNPEKISEYTLISKDSGYVERAKAVRTLGRELREQKNVKDGKTQALVEQICGRLGCEKETITIASGIAGDQIGDGSSREQAASCQRVLGGLVNFANEYATKRYRSNLLNWGILPLQTDEKLDLKVGDWLLIPNIRKAVLTGANRVEVEILGAENRILECRLGELTQEEKEILAAGSLINYYNGH
ncbi:MAG: hydratase [Lachnospiraceae bacterium]